MRAIWPFRHFGLKLLSVGLAISLWLVVAGEETVERTLRVPLEMQQFPAGLELQGDAPSSVDVRVRGASSTLAHLGAGDIVAELDMHGARAGRRLFHLTSDQVRTPFGVEVLQVTPSTVAVILEETAVRKVPVSPSIEGRPAAGFAAGPVTVDPESVEVAGPASAVERVAEVLTEPVSLAGARDRVTETVTLGLLDPTLRLRSARTATVTVQIVPAPIERTLRALPVRLRHLEPHLRATADPPAVSVTVRGSRQALARLAPGDVTAYVDVTGLGAGQYTLTARADAGAEAAAARIEPPTVQVRISPARQ